MAEAYRGRKGWTDDPILTIESVEAYTRGLDLLKG